MDPYRPRRRELQKKDRAFRDDVMLGDGLGYIAIPKNASSSLLKTFHRKLGWKWSKNPGSVIFFVVVRDPVARWISGFTQSFYRNNNDPNFIQVRASG